MRWICGDAGTVTLETQWKYEDPTAVGYPLLSVFKFMKDIWDKGSLVMGILKIRDPKDLLDVIMGDPLSEKAEAELKTIFDNGLWFDALMKADSVRSDGSAGASGYVCEPPADDEIQEAIEKVIGKGVGYTVLSVILESIDPDVDDSFSGAWFIRGCDFKWRVVYE